MSLEAPRRHGAIRSLLIAYGTIGFGYLLAGSAEPQEANGFASPHSLMVAGVAVQILVILGHALMRRCIADTTVAAQASALLELVGDAASVLLFALATLGPIFTFQSRI